MTVKIRPARGGKGFEYIIRFLWNDGSPFVERRNAPAALDANGAQHWATERETFLIKRGQAATVQEKEEAKAAARGPAETLGTFWKRFLRDHYDANRNKASTKNAAEVIYKRHLQARFEKKALSAITNADIAALKGAMAEAEKSAKTVNNVLSVLSRALKCAFEWGVIDVMPCRITKLKVPRPEMQWYEYGDYRRLIDAAKEDGTEAATIVLLAGSAGLRRGEILALRKSDIDYARKQIRVERAIWRGVEDVPKGGRGRVVQMTDELAEALRAHQKKVHLRSDKVLHITVDDADFYIRSILARCQRKAGLKSTGAIHILRHTFCSHLAAAGVPANAIQSEAGHADLATTMRYMHLSPTDKSRVRDMLQAYYMAQGAPEKAVGG